MRRREAERIRTHSGRVGRNRKAAAAAGAHQIVDLSRGDIRQIRRQYHHFFAAEFAQHPVGVHQCAVEALAAIGQYRDLRRYAIALRAHDDDLTHRSCAARGRQYLGEHRSHEM